MRNLNPFHFRLYDVPLRSYSCFIEDPQAEFMLKSVKPPKPVIIVPPKRSVWDSYVLSEKWSAQWTLQTLKVSSKSGVLTAWTWRFLADSPFSRRAGEWPFHKYDCVALGAQQTMRLLIAVMSNHRVKLDILSHQHKRTTLMLIRFGRNARIFA